MHRGFIADLHMVLPGQLQYLCCWYTSMLMSHTLCVTFLWQSQQGLHVCVTDSRPAPDHACSAAGHMLDNLTCADSHVCAEQVAVAAVDCHSMFRNVQGARGVIVLFRQGANLPMPAQLAVSLRGQQSLED